MNKKKMNIWNREFSLDVIYKIYEEEKPLECQLNAVKEFESKTIDAIKNKVEQYVLKYNRKEVGADSIDNIFKYVMPKLIYVPQVKGCKVIAVMCYYKFDPEHGLAIVFENNILEEIGPEDIVL